jgi:hypothetical protein
VYLGGEGVIQGEMLLSPFLTTRDLLRLSACATWLVPFRKQLGSVVLTPDLTRHEVMGLLEGQRRLGRLRLERASFLAHALEALRGQGGVALRSLDLNQSLWQVGGPEKPMTVTEEMALS